MTDEKAEKGVSAGESARTYNPYRKHKGYSAKGSRCPEGYSPEDMQRLLDTALPDEGNDRLLFNIYFKDDVPVGIVAFRKESKGRYHGYPESSSRVPPVVFEKLCQLSDVDGPTRRRLLRGS